MNNCTQSALTRCAIFAVVLGSALIHPGSVRADFKEFGGNLIPGYYGDQNAQIVFLTIVVGGPFNPQNAQQSFAQAVQLVQQSVAQNSQVLTQGINQLASHHTSYSDPADQYFYMGGWLNLNDGSCGWIAMTNPSETIVAYCNNSSPQILSGPGPAVGTWSSAGYNIRVQGNRLQGRTIAYRLSISN